MNVYKDDSNNVKFFGQKSFFISVNTHGSCIYRLCLIVESSGYFSGDTPTLPKLLELDIPENVGTNYYKFGTILLKDRIGSQIDAIEHNCRDSSERIVIDILKEWLKGKGKPVTWDTLIETLQRTKLGVLADNLQKSL